MPSWQRDIEPEWWGVAAGLVLAGVGWGVHATLLALAGTLAAVTALLLWVWQHYSLRSVSYRRTLSQHRAMFGEHVGIEVELVNDKLLPLTWLHVADDVSPHLTITGGTVLSSSHDVFAQMHHLLPMLPFQRVRRSLTVVCDHRGEHSFGPTALRSGNPVGYREETVRIREQDRLLVYPKVFQLVYPPLASRVPLGEHRARHELIGDPSRPMGVREYRAGDPLRHIDWRATARSTELLVQVFEPTTSLRVAVFADTRAPRYGSVGPYGPSADIAEFTIAVTASIVADLNGRGVVTGLYSSALVAGRLIAQPPTSAPTALPVMLEQLARCAPAGPTTLAQLLMSEGMRLGHGASLVVVSADFTESTLRAVGELRRRVPVTLVWVASEHGRPPAPGLGDALWEVSYRDDWKSLDLVELAQ
jgi:uncharacterized protein (DUF58 family)